MFGGEGDVGAEAVLVAADQAMYRAKEEGRNQIALFRDPAEPQREPERRQTAAARIRDALTDDRLSLHSQPIHNLASGGIERYELLLRMTSEDGELLPAASFIEAAERAGMIQELDRWVVARALAAARRAGARGRAALPARQPLRRFARPTSRCSSSSNGASTKAAPTPPDCTFEITETRERLRLRGRGRLRRPADRVRLPGRDRRLRRRLRPLPLPEADPLRPDQDRRLLRPRHAAQRRRPAHRAGDRPDRPRARQGRRSPSTSRTTRPTEMLREYGVDMAQGYHLGRPAALADALAGLTGAQLGPLDLAAVRLRQLGGELDDARILVGRRLRPGVLLQLAGELVGGAPDRRAGRRSRGRRSRARGRGRRRPPPRPPRGGRRAPTRPRRGRSGSRRRGSGRRRGPRTRGSRLRPR